MSPGPRLAACSVPTADGMGVHHILPSSRPLTHHAHAQESARWRKRAAQCAAAFSDRLSQAPIALPQLACSLQLLVLGHSRQVSTDGLGGKGAGRREAGVRGNHARSARPLAV